ncbi:uncharacterized protein A4U43_UnF6500 [Asparagus officinalis]|uniref:Uncharacterized protein n=1 Tax=Asparagus officinalis TaxID=4686 RepID=A0A1R3L6G0_ASPOF|nr:uncharacterized protein A4U43_UnF6500 [Asparagus officinalis]
MSAASGNPLRRILSEWFLTPAASDNLLSRLTRPCSIVEKRGGGFSSASTVRVADILDRSPATVPHAGGIGQLLEEVDRSSVVKKSPGEIPHVGGVRWFLEEIDHDRIVKKSPIAALREAQKLVTLATHQRPGPNESKGH